MKLRNKKTGGIIDLDIANIKAQFGGISVIPEPIKLGGDEYVYHSLAELNEEWEDYKPKEPLIKDEKIRKAVRAWAEANNLSGASLYKTCSDAHYWYLRAFDDSERGIDLDIWGELPRELVDCKYYTIKELCGEEEE